MKEEQLTNRAHYHYEKTESTNADALRLAGEGATHGTIVTADFQTAGRGRKGRSWEGAEGENISMSLIIKPTFAPDKASALTLVMALAVVHALQEFSDAPIHIKWPNDIVLNGKKVCGILTEMHLQTPDAVKSGSPLIQCVVIGVGINVNQENFPEEIRTIATSLRAEQGMHFSRTAIMERVLGYFEKYYELYLKTLDLSGLQSLYNELLVNCGRQVRVLDPQGEYTGTAQGINTSGELLVLREDGTVTAVYAGEVSVRGLYGYAE